MQNLSGVYFHSTTVVSGRASCRDCLLTSLIWQEKKRDRFRMIFFFHRQCLPLVLLATWGCSGLNPSTTAVCCVYEIFRWHNNDICYAWSVRFLRTSGRLAAAESLSTLQLPQGGESLRSYANLAIITHGALTSTLTGCTRASTPGLLGNFTRELILYPEVFPLQSCMLSTVGTDAELVWKQL